MKVDEAKGRILINLFGEGLTKFPSKFWNFIEKLHGRPSRACDEHKVVPN